VVKLKREGPDKPWPGPKGKKTDIEDMDWDEREYISNYERRKLDGWQFWFRTEGSYLTASEYEWPENPWEREIETNNEWGTPPYTPPTGPWPGKVNWEDETYITIQEKNVENSGKRVKRDSMQNSPLIKPKILTSLKCHEQA
jgi:hypothetical protein